MNKIHKQLEPLDLRSSIVINTDHESTWAGAINSAHTITIGNNTLEAYLK